MSRQVLSALLLSGAAALSGLAALAAVERVAVDCPAPRPVPADQCRILGALAGGAVDARWQPAGGGQNAQATVALEPGAAAGGGAALRVDWRFTGRQGLEYVEVRTPPIAIARLDQLLALPVKAEALPLLVRARLTDPSGETFQYDLTLAREGGWQLALVDLKGQAGHWGGDNDGRPQTPLTLRTVLFDRPKTGYDGSGRMWLGDLTAVERLPAGPALRIEAEPPPVGHLYAPGAALRLWGRAERGTVRWELCDGHGAVLAQGGGDGPEAVVDTRLPARTGHYTCRFTASAADCAPTRRDFLCAVLDGEVPPANGFAGFSVHWASGWPLEGMALLPRYGVSIARDEIGWSGVEQQKGVYAIPEKARKALEAYAANGVRPLMILDYANRHYDGGNYPNSPAAIAGFAAYGAWMAKTMGAQVLGFEVWNEWVGGCGMDKRSGDHSPAAYGPLCKAAHAALKAVDPRLTVVAIGGEYGHEMAAHVAGMIDAGAIGDAYSVHPYRYPAAPEPSDLAGDIIRISDLLKAKGRAPRVWASEVGWPTQHDGRGVDLTTQARYTARALAIMWGAGAERVFWYDFKDDGLDPLYNENNFGLVLHEKRNWAPKPAMVAFAAFNRRTASATGPRILRKDAVWLVGGRLADGRDLLIAWSETPGTAWAAAGTVERSWDLFGAPLGTMPAVVGPAPVYLVGRDLLPR